eukprot:1163914-Karenia_brevis.AAC.1
MGGPLVYKRCLKPLTVVLGESGTHMHPDPLDTTHLMTPKSSGLKCEYLSCWLLSNADRFQTLLP